MKKLLLAALAISFSPIASAGTFIVDSSQGPGTDFFDVQQAIDSALVFDGDVLLVRPGDYFGTTTSKSLTVLGQGLTANTVTIFGGLAFNDCTGNIRLDNMRFDGGLSLVKCAGISEVSNIIFKSRVTLNQVNLARLTEVRPWPGQKGTGLIKGGSTAELRECTFQGGDGASSLDAAEHIALRVAGGSQIRLAACDLQGGDGADIEFAWEDWGEKGVAALEVKDGSSAHVMGHSKSVLRGGDGGWGAAPSVDGFGGPAILCYDFSTVRVAGGLVQGGLGPWGPSGQQQTEALAGDLTAFTVPASDDPLLSTSGNFRASGTSTLTVTGPAGAPMVIFAGIDSSFSTIPNVIGELATNYLFPLQIAPIGSNGRFNFDVYVPTGTPPGIHVTAQSAVYYTTDSSTRLTNPASIFTK